MSNFFKQHIILKHLILMLLVTAAILVVVFVCIKLYARHGQEFELPEVVGANIEDLMADKSLDVTFVVVDSVFDEHDEGGRVRTQDPKPLTMVKKGRKVYVTITAYTADKTFLPDLVDLSVRQAVSQLTSAGLQGGFLKFVESPDRNAVLSLSQNGRTLHAGQELVRGSKVDLVVGRGNGDGYAIVPFVIGKNPKVARRDILTASLNVGDEIFDRGASRANAVVYRQEPDYTGVSRYPMGTTVTLYYRNADEDEVERMVKEFKVDSANIIDPVTDDEASDESLDWSIEF